MMRYTSIWPFGAVCHWRRWMNCCAKLRKGRESSCWGGDRLIKRLAVANDADDERHRGEQRDRPELWGDLGQRVALQQYPPDDAQKMGEREKLAEGLCPGRHAAER